MAAAGRRAVLVAGRSAEEVRPARGSAAQALLYPAPPHPPPLFPCLRGRWQSRARRAIRSGARSRHLHPGRGALRHERRGGRAAPDARHEHPDVRAGRPRPQARGAENAKGVPPLVRPENGPRPRGGQPLPCAAPWPAGRHGQDLSGPWLPALPNVRRAGVEARPAGIQRRKHPPAPLRLLLFPRFPGLPSRRLPRAPLHPAHFQRRGLLRYLREHGPPPLQALQARPRPLRLCRAQDGKGERRPLAG